MTRCVKGFWPPKRYVPLPRDTCFSEGSTPERHSLLPVSSVVDQIARNVLALVAAIYVPSVGIMLYGEIGRLDRPVTATEA
jgi:hypothetical protein